MRSRLHQFVRGRNQRGHVHSHNCPAHGRTYGFVTLLVIAAMLFVPATVFAQDYTYAECDAIEPAALESEIEALARAVLAEGQDHLDIVAIVDRRWIATGMDQALDQEVEQAIVQLMAEKPYWERFWSGWSGAKAEEFAAAIADLVFSSPAFTAKLDELSSAIAADVAVELEAMAARSASTSLLCVQQYVGSRYSESLLALFEAEIQGDVDEVTFESAQDQLAFSQIDGHNKAALGASIIVVTQIVRRISVSLGKKVAGRVAGRIAGRLLGRLGSALIPFAGWVVGGGLIIWDLYEGGKGSLPQIQESLQSDDVKALLRAEVALAVEEGLSEEIDRMAAQIAEELAAEWTAFCDRHTHLCSLPEESTDFRMVLNATPVEDLEKLAQLVDIFLGTLGRAQLDDSLVSGVFEDLLQLPGGALAILQQSESSDVVLAWADVAGPRLDEVAASGLFARVDPNEIVERDIPLLLTLDDSGSIDAYLSLDDGVRPALALLPEADRRRLLDNVPPSDIDWLFHHADDAGLVFPLLVSRILSGTTTVAELRSPPTVAEIPSTTPSAGSDPVSQRETDGDQVQARQGNEGQNSVFVAVMVLSVVLAISAFALGAAHVVKRSKQ